MHRKELILLTSICLVDEYALKAWATFAMSIDAFKAWAPFTMSIDDFKAWARTKIEVVLSLPCWLSQLSCPSLTFHQPTDFRGCPHLTFHQPTGF